MNVSEVLKWLEEESDRLTEECHSNADPYKTVNNSFLEGFNYALANVHGLEQPELDDNQQIVLYILKDIQTKWPRFHPSTTIGMMVDKQNEYFEELTKNQELEVYKVFIDWALEQEETE